MKSTIKLFLGEGMYQDRKEIPLRIFTFPGGEVQVRILELDELQHSQNVEVIAWIRDSDGWMALKLLRDALAEYEYFDEMKLTLPYFPYARQDRICYPGEANSSNMILDDLYEMGWESVVVADIHSNILPEWVGNIPQEDLFYNCMKHKKVDYSVIAPDAGAREKATKCAEKVGANVIYAEKKRDPGTGAILSFNVKADVVPKHCLIVDDICDGGGTFIATATELRAKGADKVGLYVTHGIFSKGINHLWDRGIDYIITTDSFWDGSVGRERGYGECYKKFECYRIFGGNE